VNTLSWNRKRRWLRGGAAEKLELADPGCWSASRRAHVSEYSRTACVCSACILVHSSGISVGVTALTHLQTIAVDAAAAAPAVAPADVPAPVVVAADDWDGSMGPICWPVLGGIEALLKEKQCK
jgi:hypothetical protein